jgi:hypothetical protein
MSMPIGHFAVGASITMVASQVLPWRLRLKMGVAHVFLFVLGGLWAMLPDIAQFTYLMHRFNDRCWVRISLFQQTALPDLTGFINRVDAFHHSRWANICFFHQFMDIIDRNDSALASGALIFIMPDFDSFVAKKGCFPLQVFNAWGGGGC